MATNNFKPFAIGTGANVLSQAEYEALAALLGGFQSGKASSAQINKALRQATFIAAALAQYTMNKTGQDILDNGDVTAFVTKMATAFGKDFQALDAGLTSLAALAGGANMLPYFTSADVFAQTSLTAIGRSLIGQSSQANALSYLGGAPLASPALTGTPVAPTAASGTNSTQLATTAFTTGALADQGIGQTTNTVVSTLDFQTYVFSTGSNFTVSSNNITNTPGGITLPASTGVSISVDYLTSAGTRVGLTLIIDTATNANFQVYKVLGVGAPGSRIWTIRQQFDTSGTIPVANGGTGATTATDALTALGAAPVVSPTFTGAPAGPTAAAGTNTTQLATTAFVTSADNLKAPLASPTLTGTPTAPTAATATNTTQIATTAFVKTNISTLAPLASPTFTGNPAAPTQVSTDSSTKLATTAFVANAVANATGKLLNVQTFTSSGTYTPTPGTTSVIVEVQGGGGGSGGSPETGPGSVSGSGAGGSGAYAKALLTSGFTGVTVTVGGPGAAGASSGASGGNGGVSSFGSLISCPGGGGGGSTGTIAVAYPTSRGGSTETALPTGGNLVSVKGKPGAGTTIVNGTVGNLGTGAASVYSAGGTGTPGELGSGAGGWINFINQSAAPGLAGGAGVVTIWEYS